MNAIPDFAAQNVGCDGGAPSRTRLERMLERGGTGKHEVRAAVHALSDAELVSFGLRAYHMNLLSLFGEAWPLERIARTARTAAISKIIGGWEYHHHYLPSLTGTADASQIEDIPLGLVDDILTRGRGLAIASFHLGPMRYIPSDLAHAGIPTCVPLARDSFSDYQSAQAANPQAALWKRLRIVNAEGHNGALALAKTLARGGCVLSTIDGNTGLDGPRGDQRRAAVRILQSTARVKTGLFAMAARFGSPILVMIAHSRGGRRLCRAAPPIDPERPLGGDERERFIQMAAQSAYSFFGTALQRHADEWSGGDLFHQWRLPRTNPQRDIMDVERVLAQGLAGGARLTINHRRIVPLGGGADIVWSDAISGRCYKFPAEMAELAEHLSAHGVRLDWLDRHAGAQRPRIWALLCQLASREAIQLIEGADQDWRRTVNARAVRDCSPSDAWDGHVSEECINPWSGRNYLRSETCS